MRILNVAEKPDAANKIAQALSDGHASRRNNEMRSCPFWEFKSRFNNQNADMVVTSVLGHLLGMDFEEKYSNWNFTDPGLLFEAEIKKFVPDDFKPLEKNL